LFSPSGGCRTGIFFGRDVRVAKGAMRPPDRRARRLRRPETTQRTPRNRAQGPGALCRQGSFAGVASDAPSASWVVLRDASEFRVPPAVLGLDCSERVVLFRGRRTRPAEALAKAEATPSDTIGVSPTVGAYQVAFDRSLIFIDGPVGLQIRLIPFSHYVHTNQGSNSYHQGR